MTMKSQALAWERYTHVVGYKHIEMRLTLLIRTMQLIPPFVCSKPGPEFPSTYYILRDHFCVQ